MSNEVRLAVLDDVQHGHLIAKAEQTRAGVECPYGRIEFANAFENGNGT